MRTNLLALGLSLITAAGLNAGPLAREQVDGASKWLLHLDLENLRATKIGEFLGKQVLDKKLSKPAADLKSQFGFDLDWRRISSITAYGTDFQGPNEPRGVLLIQTDLEVRKALDGLIEKLAAAGAGDQCPVKKLQGDPQATYAIHSQVFFGFEAGKPIIVSKSREFLDHARAVLSGERPSLKTSQSFSSFPAFTNGFFFLAAAQGFSEATQLPPQAKVLQMAEALRLALGESGDNLALNLMLKAKDPEVSQKIQQVLQGVTALVALGQVENQDLQELVKSIQVGASENMVSLKIQYPIASAIQKIKQNKDFTSEDN